MLKRIKRFYDESPVIAMYIFSFAFMFVITIAVELIGAIVGIPQISERSSFLLSIVFVAVHAVLIVVACAKKYNEKAKNRIFYLLLMLCYCCSLAIALVNLFIIFVE